MGIGGSGSLGQLMVSFEADRREVADRRVATAGIVPALDVIEDGEAGVSVTAERRAVNQLALERCEEALGHGVVVAVTDSAHGHADPEGLSALPEGQRRVLRPVIAVMDRGHVKGRQDQFLAPVVGHRPADHSSAPDIDDHRQVEKAQPR